MDEISERLTQKLCDVSVVSISRSSITLRRGFHKGSLLKIFSLFVSTNQLILVIKIPLIECHTNHQIIPSLFKE